jgi:hypothetical protein
VNNDTLGGRLADMLAAYAYDWWLQTENLEVDYARQLQETLTAYEKRKQGIAAEAAERARESGNLQNRLLTMPVSIANDLLGTIEIVAKEKALAVRMGAMNTVATPFTEKDTIRVVMLPGGNGEVIGFVKDAEGKFGSMTYGGFTFTKLEQ